MIHPRGIVLISICVALTAAFSHATERETPWSVVSFGTTRIAVPKAWRNFDKMKPNMPLYRQGDGISVPRLDETQAPLQIGMTVETYPGTQESIGAIVTSLVETGKGTPRLELVGKESVQSIKLADGTDAKLLTMEFIKQGNRRSLQMKLIAKNADSTAWVVSGHIVGGKESKWPTPESSLAKWLEAHLSSLTFDEKAFNPEKLNAAYKSREMK